MRGEGNESVYERCGMGTCTIAVKIGVVKWVKRNILRGFGYIERKKHEEFVKKVYLSEIEGPSKKGRPVVRWKARI